MISLLIFRIDLNIRLKLKTKKVIWNPSLVNKSASVSWFMALFIFLHLSMQKKELIFNIWFVRMLASFSIHCSSCSKSHVAMFFSSSSASKLHYLQWIVLWDNEVTIFTYDWIFFVHFMFLYCIQYNCLLVEHCISLLALICSTLRKFF